MYFFIKRIAVFMLLLLSWGAYAQQAGPYQFKPAKSNKATEVKSQDATGTCWSFSAVSFIESELLRLGKGTQDLSEMWIVRHIYREKAQNYIRRQGHARLSEGGLAHDMIAAFDKYGILPEKEYPGKRDADGKLNHAQLERNLIALCKELVALGEKGALPSDYMSRIDSLLDAELGVAPKDFMLGGKKYTPFGYAQTFELNPKDYINLSSFSHHPYYQPFVLEVPDNWAYGSYYNLPLDEFISTIQYALREGYTVVWDADVSNKGFSAQKGLALAPAQEVTADADGKVPVPFEKRTTEAKVTPEIRQNLFDAQQTTDDHLMHITGMVEETNGGGMFFQVKNSWGKISDFEGYLYASEAYLRLNTIGITLHKNALPVPTAERLGFSGTPGSKVIVVPPGQGRPKPAPAPAKTEPFERKNN